VQLTRAERWDGQFLFRGPARPDFIEPKNLLDDDMRAAVGRLERLGDEMRRRFDGDHGQESWFREWEAMAEADSAAGSSKQGWPISGTKVAQNSSLAKS